MTIQKDPEENEMKYLNKHVDFKNKRVLEIGCGEGRLTWNYATFAKKVVGIDTDKDAIRIALIDRAWDMDEHVFFSNANSQYLPFSKEVFDIAILAWSL